MLRHLFLATTLAACGIPFNSPIKTGPDHSGGGNPNAFGRCSGCAGGVISVGLMSLIWTAPTAIIGPRVLASRLRPAWAWIGIGLGATTLALGATHAALNHGDDYGIPIVAAVTGGPALVLGLIGMIADERGYVEPSFLHCTDSRCKIGIPGPVAMERGGGVSLASGVF